MFKNAKYSGTKDLVNAAMKVVFDKNTTWPRDSEFRIEVVMVNVPLQYCPSLLANTMPTDCEGSYPYVVAIAIARFHRTPEHPGGSSLRLRWQSGMR